MKAALKGMHSPDMELPPGTPLDDRNSVLVQLMIGPADDPGEESFDITVCTITGLGQAIRRNRSIFGRFYLFVPNIDRESIEHAITEYLSTLDESSWPELAARIGGVARWEFEDYRR